MTVSNKWREAAERTVSAAVLLGAAAVLVALFSALVSTIWTAAGGR
jgi:hypothetical protein